MGSIYKILFFAFLIRLFFLPFPGGSDFVLWEMTTDLVLDGENIYEFRTGWDNAHSIFAYPPLFLFVLVPLKYLARELNIPFLVLAKLPAVFSDIFIGYLIYLVLSAYRRSALWGAAFFVFNPLVIYASALYGLFDSVALLFMFAAFFWVRKPLSPLLIGMAIGIKTFPLFVLPGLFVFWKTRKIRNSMIALSVPLLVSIPFIILNARQFFWAVFVSHAGKFPQYLSWQTLLPKNEQEVPFSIFLLGSFTVFTVFLAFRFLGVSSAQNVLFYYGALVFSLFILLNKVVFEHYLIWALPFLLVIFFEKRIMGALVLYALFTVMGLVFNDYFLHNFPGGLISLLPFGAMLLGIVTFFSVAALIKQGATLYKK